MGIGKISFGWYLKHIAPLALLGYFVGAGAIWECGDFSGRKPALRIIKIPGHGPGFLLTVRCYLRVQVVPCGPSFQENALVREEIADAVAFRPVLDPARFRALADEFFDFRGVLVFGLCLRRFRERRAEAESE